MATVAAAASIVTAAASRKSKHMSVDVNIENHLK